MNKTETSNLKKYTDAAETLLNLPIDFTGMSSKEIDEINTAINLAVASLKQTELMSIAWNVVAYYSKSLTAEIALDNIKQAYLKYRKRLIEAASII